MTIATNIAEYTNYDSTDVSNAVTASTRLCGNIDIDDDELIESGAVWLLERQTAERQAVTDPSIAVPKMEDFYKFMLGIKGRDIDDSIALFAAHGSPASKGLDPYNPS